MQDAFGIVIFVVVAIAIVAAVWAAAGSGALYRQIGRGGLSLDSDDEHARRAVPAAVSRAVADEEIRQMLTARNARRAARGQAPLDVEEELARLTGAGGIGSGVDPQLEAEIRSLVIARNERRERQGKAPLDVEAEVRRQIQELT